MSRSFWILLMVSVVVTIAAGEYWRVYHFPHTPAGIQQDGMAQAEAHLPVIQTRLHDDARFKDVRLGVYTGLDGAVDVWGRVASEQTLEDLKTIVESTRPPRPVHWMVKVDEK